MVGIIDDSCIRYPIGSRIKVGSNCGTVKYVGEVTGHAGTWLGIEWDDPKRGKHDGSVDGKYYFQTHHQTAGSFVRPGKIGAFLSLEEAVRNRYQDYTVNSLDQDLIKSAQHTLQAPLFEIVGMEKIARKQSKFEQLMEINVADCDINTAGYLKDFSVLTTLNLSRTLIWNWEIVADTVKQLPTLINLDLSSNRLQLPTDEQIMTLEPAFRKLKSINLGNCGYNNWDIITHTARLWPHILSVGLQGNAISTLAEPDCKHIFKNLEELHLDRTQIMDFDEICKLGYIKTLKTLNLMENGIEQMKLPDCEPNAKLNIFVSLENLALLHNPIWNEADAFNELDKLPKLKKLRKTPHLKSNYDEMFSKAVGSITNLEVLNGTFITANDRRGAEYDNWKKYGLEWLQANKSPETLLEFYKRHRSYANIIKKYGSPADFVLKANVKQSNLLKIRIKDQRTGDIWEKKVPRMITVQTLQGLIMKRFHLENCIMPPQLSYADAKHPTLIVPLDNPSKTLDFYSVQENDTVVAEW